MDETQLKFVGRGHRYTKVKVKVVKKVKIAKIIYTLSIFQLETSDQRQIEAPDVLEFLKFSLFDPTSG